MKRTRQSDRGDFCKDVRIWVVTSNDGESMGGSRGGAAPRCLRVVPARLIYLDELRAAQRETEATSVSLDSGVERKDRRAL